MASNAERKYINLRKRLDQLGYRQPLAIESLPLVEKLFRWNTHTNTISHWFKRHPMPLKWFCSRFIHWHQDQIHSSAYTYTGQWLLMNGWYQKIDLPLFYSDLVHTTESLRSAKLSAGKNEKESQNLDSVLEPYKTENARVIRENNELHLDLMKLKEEKDRLTKGK